MNSITETIEEDVIYPPTPEQVQDLRTHNIGMAIRFSSRLGRPLTDWEYEMFRNRPAAMPYQIVELPNERFGISMDE
jgi:hypothetical protein